MNHKILEDIINHCADPKAHVLVVVGSRDHYDWFAKTLGQVGFEMTNHGREQYRFSATLGSAKVTVVFPPRNRPSVQLMGYHPSYLYVDEFADIDVETRQRLKVSCAMSRKPKEAT